MGITFKLLFELPDVFEQGCDNDMRLTAGEGSRLANSTTVVLRRHQLLKFKILIIL